ncbi:hypothetical protein ABN034_21630 [Actinopolymorpha sp. B11F2]|uniref:hypothetical protein n=1 Tax=Actinopolymorpha sp. B11F2 TaxID=3160862 RepID=UPI0032E4CFE2
MTRRIEHELVTTLESAAGRAPRPEPGLLDQLERRHRRRRQRGQIFLATGAVLAVAGGSAALFGTPGASGGDTTLTPADPPADLPAAGSGKVRREAPTSEPVEKIWPAAVHDVPDRLADGRKFRPQTMVDDRTVLVSVDAGFENVGELWLYDIQDRTARKVTTVRTPKDATIFASNFTVGEGHVVWWIAHPDMGLPSVELWAAPLAGGEAHLVGRVHAKGGVEGDIAITDGQVMWSHSGGGVYQAPLAAGGEAELIEGTDDFGLVDWPWVGTPVRSRQSWSGSMPDEITYRTLRNLQTGEERIATERDGLWTCRVQWCVGATDDGGAVQRRDGTGHREVGSVMTSVTYGNQPARDRFVLAEDGSRSVIYDIRTGKAGRVAALDGGGFRMMGDERLYYVETEDGYQLVDMAAIDASDPAR